MKIPYGFMTVSAASAALCFALLLAPLPGRGQSSDEKAREEAKAKRNAKVFENNATVLTVFDREGNEVGTVGERALYDAAFFSPDRSRIAVITEDLAEENADLWVLDIATGKSTRITTSARRDFVLGVVWSPDGSQLAYPAMRSGKEGVYQRSSNGEGPEKLLYSNPGAFMNLTDWSPDGRFLTFTKSDLGGGTLYVLPLGGSGERTPMEIFHTDSRVFGARFSPDGRYLSYTLNDPKEPKNQLFVRPFDPSGAAPAAGPWKLADEAGGPIFWHRDGTELYYVGLDRSVQAVEIGTSPSFAFKETKTLFRPPGVLPLAMAEISRDGERFLSFPPPKGPQLQQITMYGRNGKVARKIAEPGLYSQPAFSPDGTRLVVLKSDPDTGRRDIWTFEIATGKAMQLTDDALPKNTPMWSHDGRQILYTSSYNTPTENATGVYRRPSDGSGSAELLFRYTPGAGLNLTDISPDGKFLACASGGVLLIVPLTGSNPLAREPIEFVREEYSTGNGRFSPDGRFLAYVSNEADFDRNEVWVMAFDASTGMPGEGKWRLSTSGAAGMQFWRADGKEFLYRKFVEPGSDEFALMSASVTTSPEFQAEAPQVVFRLPGPIGGNLGDISPDGRLVVFAENVPAESP